VVLRPGIEETEENITNLMESRLQDHERIRGGLYFIQSIPRDENWKVRKDLLQAYEPKKTEDCTLNVSACLPTLDPQKTPSLAQNLSQQVPESPKLARKLAGPSGEVTQLEKQANGAYVAGPDIQIEAASSPRTKRAVKKEEDSTKKLTSKASMDCIFEDTASNTVATASAATGTRGGARRVSKISTGSTGSSRRGSTETHDMTGTMVNSNHGNTDKAEVFTYWLQVTVSPQVRLDLLIRFCKIKHF